MFTHFRKIYWYWSVFKQLGVCKWSANWGKWEKYVTTCIQYLLNDTVGILNHDEKKLLCVILGNFTSVSNTSIASNVIRIREGGSGGKERD